MDDNMSQRRPQKRPIEADADDDNRWKKQLVVKLEGDVVVPRRYKFRVLLPNGTSIGITVRDPNSLMTIQQFLGKVREEYNREIEVNRPRRGVNWSSPDLFFIDASDNRLRKLIDFNKFQPNKLHILRLNDGTKAANMYKNMWDLTPDTDLLKELPEEYTFETALADLIDNSLQAVWSNGINKKKLISVEVTKDKISIFDTGPGMDNSEENAIVKWGKMGASLHRSCRGKAIGGKPPYLNPVFGMFGYGGPIASMHLGRRAEVSSKTKDSKKVYLLELEREALLNRSGSKKTWGTAGNFRDPLEDEISRSPDGSFTKVDIFEPKMRSLDISRLQCKLKDIYFPYIQCDELSKSGRTITPIEFQVNGTDLAEVDGGEVAIANLHSCNGPEFVLQLCFHFNQDCGASSSQGARAFLEANARLKCVYFPVIEGKETIESILEKLEDQEYGITEKYESFSRVCVRRLGRLLPDARWTLLPFMDLRQRKGDKAQVLKRCCLRVKCFIDTDAGFNPTPSKTDLAHQNPYTNALKNFGNKQPLGKERDIQIEIKRDGKPLTLLQLDKQYQDWIIQMHEQYDEEVDCGVDEPVIIVSPSKLKELGISTNVVRVHKLLQRRGTSWKSGQKIKVLKGACAGCHKSNVYATVEFFLLEGFQGDAGGEARLICRPIHIPEMDGCLLINDYENPRLDLRKSITLPISAIDSGKCLAMESAEWDSLLQKQHQKSPSSIEILSARYCQQLGIAVALPVENVVDAGHVPPEKVVAVIRPASFSAGSTSENLDQKYIVKENFEMALEVKFMSEDKDLQYEGHKYSGRETPTSLCGFHGLYVFQLKCKSPPLFQKAGVYTFSFSLRESSCRNLVKKIQVKGLSEVQRCGILRSEQVSDWTVRVGLCFPPFSIACYDRYDNQIQVTKVPEVVVKVCSNRVTLAEIGTMNVSISSNKSALRVKDLRIESSELDSIRPSYEATLMICQRHGLFSVDIPFKVYPGSLERVKLQAINFERRLLPGHVIKELVLEMFDAYGNHMRKNEEILLKVDGFCFQDKAASVRKVDDQGCVDLSGLLKVTEGYGKTDYGLQKSHFKNYFPTVSISVLSGKKEVFKEELQIDKRELRVASVVPKTCAAGSQLENIVFEVIDSKGDVDDSIHDEEKLGQSHTLTVKSDSMNIDDTIKYCFRHGRCTVRTIPIPKKEGNVSFVALHSCHSELQMTFEVHVEPALETEKQNIQPLSSDGNSLVLPDSPVFKASRVEYDDEPRQFSDDKTLLLPDASSGKKAETLIRSISIDLKELEDELCKYGLSVGEHEEKLHQLQIQQSAIEQDLSELQASMDLVLCSTTGDLIGRKEIMEKIENKIDCAAAAVCYILRYSRDLNPNSEFLDRVIGVVAFLGSVQTIELSRIFAEFLGDQMLAVVCKSYKDLNLLERYEQNGSIKRDRGLRQLAPEVGTSINGRYLVLCLENIRPYMNVSSIDPQRKLALPDPTLPNGAKPVGYLGYAVNMINLPVDHLYTRTGAGHGLRETLFYRLFGELQVYETREYMELAKSYVQQGAVSLDGAIMRGNGAVSLGCCEPDILFPVVTTESQMHPSPHTLEVVKQFESKKLKHKETVTEKERVTKSHKKLCKKFSKKRDHYNKFLEKKSSLLETLENEAGSLCSICSRIYCSRNLVVVEK